MGLSSPLGYLREFQRQRPHMSLNFEVPETPEQAFYQKCEEIIPGNFVAMIKRECGVDI